MNDLEEEDDYGEECEARDDAEAKKKKKKKRKRNKNKKANIVPD